MGILTIKRSGLSNLLIGIYKIDKDLNELLSELDPSPDQINQLSTFSSVLRKKQWVATRVLLKMLLPNTPEILYEENGAPHLSAREFGISISHSGEMIAVMIGKGNSGIDLEKSSEKIRKIRGKFLSSQELESFVDDDLLHISWGAKESLFKMYRKGKVDFRKDIFIEPFTVSSKGQIWGWIKGKRFPVYYQKQHDFYLVYVQE